MIINGWRRRRGCYLLAVAFAGGFFATGTFDAVGGGGGGTLRGKVDGKSRHDSIWRG